MNEDQKYNKSSDYVTMDMIKRNRGVDDDWHFAQNLNAMMRLGYCKKCGLVPVGCEREGCGAKDTITAIKTK